MGSDPSSAPRYYYVYNTHGDVVSLVDASGNSVASYSYDSWGNLTSSSETFPGGANGWTNPYRYDGHDGARYDASDGLSWLAVRAYDQSIGRFLSHDPLGRAPLFLAGSDNSYVYAGNNPITNIDPSGTRFALARGSAVKVAPRHSGNQPSRIQTHTVPAGRIPPDAPWRWQKKGDVYQIWIKGPEIDRVSGRHYNLHVQHYGGSVDLHNYHLTWGGEIPANCPGQDDPSGEFVWLYLPDIGTMASPSVNGDGFIKEPKSVGIGAASELAGMDMAIMVTEGTRQYDDLGGLAVAPGKVFFDLAENGGER